MMSPADRFDLRAIFYRVREFVLAQPRRYTPLDP